MMSSEAQRIKAIEDPDRTRELDLSSRTSPVDLDRKARENAGKPPENSETANMPFQQRLLYSFLRYCCPKSREEKVIEVVQNLEKNRQLSVTHPGEANLNKHAEQQLGDISTSRVNDNPRSPSQDLNLTSSIDQVSEPQIQNRDILTPEERTTKDLDKTLQPREVVTRKLEKLFGISEQNAREQLRELLSYLPDDASRNEVTQSFERALKTAIAASEMNKITDEQLSKAANNRYELVVEDLDREMKMINMRPSGMKRDCYTMIIDKKNKLFHEHNFFRIRPDERNNSEGRKRFPYDSDIPGESLYASEIKRLATHHLKKIQFEDGNFWDGEIKIYEGDRTLNPHAALIANHLKQAIESAQKSQGKETSFGFVKPETNENLEGVVLKGAGLIAYMGREHFLTSEKLFSR